MAAGEILYFARPGVRSTAEVARRILRRVDQGGIAHVVVASDTGATALRMNEALEGSGVTLVAVAEHTGFWGGDQQKLTPQMRLQLEAAGIQVFIGAHALSGVGRSITNKFGGVTPTEIIAHTLRLFGGEGLKVAVEVAVMAADAGLIPTDCECIAVGGTGRGADTAVVLRAAHMNNFFDLEVREILAKPRQRPQARK